MFLFFTQENSNSKRHLKARSSRTALNTRLVDGYGKNELFSSQHFWRVSIPIIHIMTLNMTWRIRSRSWSDALKNEGTPIGSDRTPIDVLLHFILSLNKILHQPRSLIYGLHPRLGGPNVFIPSYWQVDRMWPRHLNQTNQFVDRFSSLCHNNNNNNNNNNNERNHS